MTSQAGRFLVRRRVSVDNGSVSEVADSLLEQVVAGAA